ncbi:MAG: HAD hydrolase-like protein [Bacteroidales bacterium]|nr:HAD hydrolase-like protein [Bacteroidales bacterium]
MLSNIKVIAFDADDTLWVNEPYYRQTEHKFADLLSEYLPEKECIDKLFEIEMKNLELYGYGAKSFVLSMIETALQISNYKIEPEKIEKIINFGKELNSKIIEVLPDVKKTLSKLQNTKYKLIIATKGDLLDQERKLKKSGLASYFHHIEVMSNKKEADYLKLLNRCDINPENFLMVGNSLKSDIVPVLKIGGTAVFIPVHTTWIHEETDENEIEKYDNYYKINSIKYFEF